MLLAVLIGFAICYAISIFVKLQPWRALAMGIVILAVGIYLLDVSGMIAWLDSLGSRSRGSR
jgi:hypothetical protein